MDEQRLLAYQKRIRELEQEVSYYQSENARLTAQNEVLHETAWGLVMQLREIQAQKKEESAKKD